MNKLLWALLLIPTLVMGHNHEMIDDFTVGGFIGYRHVWSSNNTDLMQSYPELGLIVDWNMSENFHTFTQLNLNPNAIDHGIEHALIYGFVDYSNTIKTVPFRVSVGKLRHQFGLHNDIIHNPLTRPGIIPPQAVTFNPVNATLTSGYGVKLEVWLGDWVVGYTIDKFVTVDEKVESQFWTGFDFVDIDPKFGNHMIWTMNWEPDDLDWKMRSSMTHLKLNDDLPYVDIAAVGIEYDNDDWSASLETVILKPDDMEWFNDFADLRFGVSATVGKMITDQWNVYVNYNTYLNSRLSTRARVDEEVDKWRDFNVGTSYDIEDVQLRLEVHKISGGRALNPKDWDAKTNSWWIVGTSVTYQF